MWELAGNDWGIMRCRVSFIRGAIKDDDYLSFWVKREENRNQPWGMGGGGNEGSAAWPGQIKCRLSFA